MPTHDQAQGRPSAGGDARTQSACPAGFAPREAYRIFASDLSGLSATRRAKSLTTPATSVDSQECR